MSLLRLLRLDNFRKFNSYEVEFAKNFTFIVGDNASGKTSLLEAINILSRLKSFRTSSLDDTVSFDNPQQPASIFAKIVTNDLDYKLGFQRDYRIKKTTYHLNGEALKNNSSIVKILPVQVLTQDDYLLITGSPKQRRKLLDWSCFYHESDFIKNWRDYSKLLKQRNFALKTVTKHNQLEVWDNSLVDFDIAINKVRAEVISSVSILIKNYARGLLNDDKLNLSLEYYSGWTRGLDLNDKQVLLDKLKSNFYRDKKIGYTTSGCHKADLILKIDDKPIDLVLSRGQKKMLVAAIVFANAKFFEIEHKIPSLILLDDFNSELDEDNVQRLINTILQLKTQSILTSTNEALVQKAIQFLTGLEISSKIVRA